MTNQLQFPCRNQLDKLQSVTNAAAAQFVCSARKYEHITPLLRDLHWLLVRARIAFNLAVLVFRCLHGTTANELCRVIVWQTLTEEGGCAVRQRLLS